MPVSLLVRSRHASPAARNSTQPRAWAGWAGWKKIGVVVGSAFAMACASQLRVVPQGPHREESRSEPVPGPPPDVQVEHVRERPPGPGCSWLDGSWERGSGRWQWVPGRWVVPPANCYHAPSELSWREVSGESILYYLPSRWYSRSEGTACPAPTDCTPSANDPG